MRYIGGKSKLASSISSTILELTKNRSIYLEPFVGGASVFERLAPNFKRAIGADLSPDLIALWHGVSREGFIPPTEISETLYAALREAEPSALRGYVGFGGSFGGKFFGGYARGGFQTDGSPRNHQAESARAILRIASALQETDTHFRVASYEAWNPRAGHVVYCDPPYAGTQGYTVGQFDSGKFWATMDQWVSAGAEVFVSEYHAPDHWEPVWERKHRQSLVLPEQGRNITMERLFSPRARYSLPDSETQVKEDA